jgi:tetratricopeptide (TPR) repeat protein
LKKTLVAARAICTFLFILLLLAAPADALGTEQENLTRYRDTQLSAGAKTLPTLARLAHLQAVSLLRDGKRQEAEAAFLQALAYDPQYAKPYFFLALLKARQFDPEAGLYLSRALFAIGRSFKTQSMLAVNATLIIPYILILLSLIVCVAFGVKYLPFAAHRLREFLQYRMRAALPGPSAYLILLLPLVVLPGAIPMLAYSTILCWLFMQRREKFLMVALLVPFILFGFCGSYLRPLTPLADPKSMTSLVADANEAPGNAHLVRAIETTQVPGLEAEKSIALGLLPQRTGSYTNAADHFYKAISLDPNDTRGYINLGNVYFLQGSYDKALEGYRKAESINPNDAVCQHALAQAYIKTLFMKEASKSLLASSALGLGKVKASYAPEALDHIAVFPQTISNRELWRMAIVEGKTSSNDVLNEKLSSLMRIPRNTSAWILLAGLAIALVLSRVVDPRKLTFQCSNCGQLTCEKCCNTERDVFLCQDCAKTVAGVTSEKVTDALLRQRRQTVVVSRRKASRFATMLLPGMRDISYGRISRGFWLAVLFSSAVVQLLAKGLFVKDVMSFPVDPSPWRFIVAAAMVVLAYSVSILSKPQYSFKAYRQPKYRIGDVRIDTDDTERVA